MGVSAKQVVSILVVRHPDYENEFTVSAPKGIEVKVINVDLGSGFDSEPDNDEEAQYAMEIVESISNDIADLPDDDKVKVAAKGIIDQLREAAGNAIDLDEFVGDIPCTTCGGWFYKEHDDEQREEEDGSRLHCTGCDGRFDREVEKRILGEV